MQSILGMTTTGSSGKPLIETSRSGTRYFAKGHLSPDAAFIYDVFQDATYYFVNVAPQFQTFNNGNWKALEMATRDYASRYHFTVQANNSLQCCKMII
jgi:DNA/RNA endonuclease G (NUC1)